MRPSHISILGVGLLGGSIGLAVRPLLSTCKITGYGHRRSTLDKAVQIGALDQGYDDAAEAVRGAELVVLCTPVGLFEEVLGKMKGGLASGAVVTDVGSTKRSIVELAQRLLPPGVHFVGSHPMAGSEKRGVEYARADLFRGATCILTPTTSTDAGALARVEGFWQLLGMRTTRLSPDEHDRLLAEVSHLPHAVAAALVAMQEEAGLDLAGKGFLDATRIAGGDGGLWRDIFLDNRDNLKAGIERLRGKLGELVAMMEKGDGEALREWLDANAKRRADLLARKVQEMHGE